MPVIKTPDQRLRVFISSTIQELAAERKSVRNVVEAMKLTPVFFESGARPHPPKDLYRSYLDQSDVFIGIYGQSYGWVAPDMDISGLEDEWKLSNDKPKLIYIKEVQDREPKLVNLLKNIQKSDVACYQKFGTADELSELLSNDLAILLTERFQTSENHHDFANQKPKTNLPTLRNEIIGRSNEIDEIKGKLALTELGLITLIGPGGTGKTRLALEVGKELLSEFKDGVYFVSLASITEGARLPSAIAQVLGMNNNGITDVGNWVLDYLYDKSLLLILDNFEQIVDASIYVSELLNKCQHIKIIVTSRTPLYIRSENIFHVDSLDIKPYNVNNLQHSDAIELFIQRATESNSSIEWNEENIKSVYSICNKLDGLPLAIELAAARCRHLSPIQLDSKMDKILDAISSGPRDYPERQKTLRNTIQWSFDLLEPVHQRLFRRLSVFENGWSFEAMEIISWKGFSEAGDAELSLEALTDYGLVEKLHSESGYKGHKLLQIIKEYAEEKIAEAGEENELRIRHCDYYQKLSQSNSEKIWMSMANKTHLYFREDYDNFVSALHFASKMNDQNKVWSLISSINSMYMITGEIGFLFEWLEKANIKSDPENIANLLQSNSKFEIVLSLLAAGFTRTTTGNFEEGLRDLMAARQLGKEINVHQIESSALLFMGLSYVTIRNFDIAKELLEESIVLSELGNQFANKITAEITLQVVYVERNDLEKAKELLDNAIVKSRMSFMPLVESFALYQRGYLYLYTKEFDLALRKFEESKALNLKYNLNLNASFPLMGSALVYTEFLQFDVALQTFRNALECLRISGNNIEFECFKYALCYFLIKSGQTEKALRLYSFIKRQFQITNFRPWITQSIYLDHTEKILGKIYSADFLTSEVEHSSEMSREEIYSLIQE